MATVVTVPRDSALQLRLVIGTNPDTGAPIINSKTFNKIKSWNEPLGLDTLSLNTPCIPESYSLPATSRIPLEADTPKRNATSSYYTHLQHAQPLLFSHHLMAYFYMFERDKGRMQDLYKRIDVLPLGSAALAGTSFPIDREYVASQLGFSKVSENSLDAVSDRDFILEFLSASAILMMHLSRLGEELVLWSSQEFNFIELDDSFCTGSSIMPQKKNPDAAELIRGKTGRVYGNLINLLTMMKALPLAYNHDMQEDKEPLFDTVSTLESSLFLMSKMIETMQSNKEKMEENTKGDFSTATELADYLVKKGLSFREAHRLMGKIVLYCLENKKNLEDLTLTELKSFHKEFSEDTLEILKPCSAVEAKDSYGGTSLKRVKESIQKAKQILEEKY